MKVFVSVLALSAHASAFTAVSNSCSSSTQLSAVKDDIAFIGKAALAGAIAIGAAVAPAQAITKSEINQLSYLQVKGTGLANRCAEVIGEDSIKPQSGSKLLICVLSQRLGQ